MKAMRFGEYGGPDVLHYEDTQTPKPEAGQVLIEVAASTFNPVDLSIRAGYLQNVFPLPLPHTPGIDVSGTVREIGASVSGLTPGEHVIAFLPMDQNGSAAEFVLAPAEVVTQAPGNIPLVDAAALPSSGLTAWQALFEFAGLHAGQRILMDGAGGGVGGYAVQLAKQAGAYVIATASERSAEAVRSNGADEIIDYTRTRVADAVREPVDVVLSLVRVSDEEMASLVGLVRPGGIIVTTGSTAPEDTARGVRSVAVSVRNDAAQLASLVKKVDAGELKVDVSATYPLSSLAEVHTLGAAGKLRGKVLVTP